MHAMMWLRIWLAALAVLMAMPADADSEAQRKDALFDALTQVPSVQEARAIELQIYALWAHTDSPSVRLIFDQAGVLIGANDWESARAKLDVLTEIAPNFVEGWSFRALASRHLRDYDRAIMDLRRVLNLEPKHFRALGLLGSIFRELNDPKSALEAYEAAVKINPHMEGGAAAVRQLTEEVNGRGI